MKKLPRLPTTLPTVLGPIPVERVTGLRDSHDKACLGICRFTERDVRIESAVARTAAWHTFWHEWTHMTLWDAGLELDEATTERLCDAFALARVREMLDG